MQPSKNVIMVIDSSQTIRNLMGVILLQAGYEAMHSGNVMEALYLLTRLPPDLIFIATTLPGMQGRDVCKFIKSSKQTRDIPIIMLTSDDATDNGATSDTAYIAGTLMKPFTPQSVLACLATHCARRDNALEST